MPFAMKHEKGYLDRKHCFHTYINTNSIGKTIKVLVSEGVRNPKTGKAPTPMGVWNAVWLYALDNLPEAKKLAFETWRNNGIIGTEEQWSKLVLGKARYLLSNRKYTEFLERHSYLKPYLENK